MHGIHGQWNYKSMYKLNKHIPHLCKHTQEKKLRRHKLSLAELHQFKSEEAMHEYDLGKSDPNHYRIEHQMMLTIAYPRIVE
jgi:hypothetical protein